jgi:uncharacterized protein (TIGR00299 family) protein
MILGALVDAGLDLDLLRDELSKLSLGDVSVRIDRVTKRHISAAQFEVVIAGRDEHLHSHEHSDAGRSLSEIGDLIGQSSISPTARERALDIYRLLGEAEGKVHGVPVSEVHFHEIGAIDSIVDIVGAAIAVELLGLDAIYCSPLPTGSGMVETQHGLYPVPAPATLEVIAARRVPTRPSRVESEQVTPTGAAILAALASFEQPSMRPKTVGYGAGHADLPVPNVLRVWIGETEPDAAERLVVLQTNIDDMSPELSAHVLDRCLGEGALEALLVPVVMKKGRPGVQLEVLCRPERLERIREVVFAETTTLGLRWWEVERLALPRERRLVETPYGSIGVTVRLAGPGEERVAPEYEDCRRAAAERGVPLTEVYRAAMAAAGG